MANSLKLLKKVFKDRKAVSETLAAIMMIFMFIAAIGVVWGYLYPTYKRFQTDNAMNSVASYMLGIDSEMYDLLSDGPDSTAAINIDNFFGYYLYETGKNASLQFTDEGGTFSNTYDYNNMGAFSFWMIGRQGSDIPVSTHKYLKGPDIQNNFFVNNSDSSSYQGLTNLTLTRPETDIMKIELNYRVSLYYWYDQANDVLTVTINLLVIDIIGTKFMISSYNSLNIDYNESETIFTDSANISTDFYIDGSIAPGFDPFERVLNFAKPAAVGSYDVNIEVIANYFIFYN